MLQSYRVEILAPSPGADMRVVEEREIRARDAGSAIDEMLRMLWPPKATLARLVDIDGRVIVEQLRE